MFDDITTVSTLRARLAQWYEDNRRSLPWREAPTPYRVWVSEIMLQQTQVATVIPYFERFITAFPTVNDLAEAPEEAVLSHWAGLGYYRRCRYLHAGAKVVATTHKGVVPSDVATLLTLPGVGRYTAGAISSIAFGEVASVLDGNVARVLSRVLALNDAIDGGPGQRTLWKAADALVCPDAPGRHNQGMMELGALVCSPSQPDCPICPLHVACQAHATCTTQDYPKKKPRKKAKAAFAVAGFVTDDEGRILMARRPTDVLLGGLWELPGGEITPEETRPAIVRKWLDERVGVKTEVGARLAQIDHVFTHRRLTLEVYSATTRHVSCTPSWYTEVRWVAPGHLSDLPLSRLTQKVLTAVGHEQG